MLKRRSIRTKLIVALTLLSAIVLLLAFSGMWGLYRYRHLANAVSAQARNIPDANDLNRFALTLRESNNRSSELRDHEGMIQTTLIDEPLFDIDGLERLEQSRFQHAVGSFSDTLKRYSVAASAQQQSLLVDNAHQQRSLGEIRQTLDTVEGIHRTLRPMDVARRKSDLTAALDLLVTQTDEHVEIIHKGMAEFSDEVSGQYRAWIGMAWFCTILAISMVGILLWALRSLVVKPFRTLLDGSRLVAGGQFDHRIDLGTGDELSELADAMNKVTDRFQGALAQIRSYCNDLDRQVHERTREVIQNEQLASVGFLAAGVAHEINNPLATIAWSAESLQSRIAESVTIESGRRVIDDEVYEELVINLRRIEEEAYRCEGITKKLLDFSRLSEVRRSTTDLVELVEDVVEMVSRIGTYNCKTIRTHIEDPVVAYVNPQEIRQVVLNLVTNALESVDSDGAVDVHVCAEESNASVVVKDDGCGMSDDVLQHLFEPFFTRRRDGTGTGLGLSITYRIVSQHGGSLTAKSEGENRGSQLEVLLPVTPE